MAMSCDMLLHPELMSNAQLIFIIQERHLRVPNLETMSRDELLSVFHHFCVPYGQRKYKDSGRGRILNKNRNCEPETSHKINTFNSVHLDNEWSNSNLKYSTQDDRLKPPPDHVSGRIKRIKLDSNLVKESDRLKRKIPIDSITLTTDCTPPKKERKPITWP